MQGPVRLSLSFSLSHPSRNLKHPTEKFYVIDHAGNGGTSISGSAHGGNAKRSSSYPYPYPYPYFPSYSQGGNAQTGSSGNVNGGDVVNYGGYIWNGWGASKCSVYRDLSSTYAYDFDETQNPPTRYIFFVW